MKQTFEIPLQMRLAAITSPNPDKRTAEMVWTTGAAVKRMDWWTGDMYYEELSLDPGAVRLDRLNGGAPLLDTHDSGELEGILGVVDRAWMTATDGRAEVRFSRRPEVEPYWQDVQDGIIRNVSVGYIVHKYQDVTPSDEKIKRLRAVDWEPLELSLVPIGADAKAGVRKADEAQTHPCEIEISERSDTEAPAADVTSAPEVARATNSIDRDLAEWDYVEQERG